MLLFTASMITLWRTNNAADRRACEERRNERDRDFRLWQRDTLLRISDEVMEAGLEAHRQYGQFAYGAEPSQESLDAAKRKILGSIARLRLIGADETSQRCRELHEAVTSDQLVVAVAFYTCLGTSLQTLRCPNRPSKTKRNKRTEARLDQLMERLAFAYAACPPILEVLSSLSGAVGKAGWT